MRRLRTLVHVPDRATIARTSVLALMAAAVCWYFGATVWESLMLGCAITIVLLVARLATVPEVRDLRWHGTARAGTRGSRADVSTLAFRLRGSWGRIDYSVQRRARAIARRRLSFEGLDLQNADHRPAIERLIGSDSYDFLVRTQNAPPKLRELLHCLDVLDTLDPAFDPAHRAPSESRFPFLTRLRQRRDP
jgi:hypothetical protein